MTGAALTPNPSPPREREDSFFLREKVADEGGRIRARARASAASDPASLL
jgi:hypothetical protein